MALIERLGVKESCSEKTLVTILLLKRSSYSLFNPNEIERSVAFFTFVLKTTTNPQPRL